MLGHWYRLQIQNGTGVSVTCTVTMRRWKFGSDGSITWDTEQTVFSAVSVSTGAFSSATASDNSTDKWLGAHFTVTFAPGSSATGSLALRLQRSTDAGTTWPDNGRGTHLAGAYFSSSSTAVKETAILR